MAKKKTGDKAFKRGCEYQIEFTASNGEKFRVQAKPRDKAESKHRDADYWALHFWIFQGDRRGVPCRLSVVLLAEWLEAVDERADGAALDVSGGFRLSRYAFAQVDIDRVLRFLREGGVL